MTCDFNAALLSLCVALFKRCAELLAKKTGNLFFKLRVACVLKPVYSPKIGGNIASPVMGIE